MERLWIAIILSSEVLTTFTASKFLQGILGAIYSLIYILNWFFSNGIASWSPNLIDNSFSLCFNMFFNFIVENVFSALLVSLRNNKGTIRDYNFWFLLKLSSDILFSEHKMLANINIQWSTPSRHHF